jgi:septal ring factor EnvC (AmiA/AmiB activator)
MNDDIQKARQAVIDYSSYNVNDAAEQLVEYLDQTIAKMEASLTLIDDDVDNTNQSIYQYEDDIKNIIYQLNDLRNKVKKSLV